MEEKNVGIAQTLSVWYVTGKVQLRLNSSLMMSLGAGALRWLNTVLAVSEYTSFAKSWQEKGCSSQAETWRVESVLMKDVD